MIAYYYDQLHTWGKEDDFFMELLQLTKAKKIADLGCGTGRVTIELAKAGYEVTGIDPNEEAVLRAQNKAHAQSVSWIIGDSQDLTANAYDAVIMTANVAQVFITEESWNSVLQDVFTALKQGGHFIFDARNPQAKTWEEWQKDETVDELQDVYTGDPLLYWDEYEGLDRNVFTFYEKIKNVNTDITHEAKVQLIFRSFEEISSSLKKAGFSIVNTYEDFKLQPATNQAKSFIFHCVK
ncbi:methyltransferase domain-containing protein [Solibacillus sp. FSL W7-1464]|uniref:class I SAM-dependent methyltransferase n=1 Tax=Solibacillus sp. FSL W7-1464 TaxID=2921706 RepID=UPI0030F66E4E